MAGYIGKASSVTITDALTKPNNLSDVSDAATSITNLGITSTAAELNILDGVTATTTELNYLDGVTSNIQTQLNNAGGISQSQAIMLTLIFGGAL